MLDHQEEHRLHHQEEDCSLLLQEVVLDLLVQADILVQLDYLHNLLDLAVYQEVYFHQEEHRLHHQEEDCSLLLQEVVLDLLVHHFEGNQAHKGYRHNLDLELFHLEEEEGQLVNM